MRKGLLFATAAVWALSMSAAGAADYYRAPPPAYPAYPAYGYNWSGAYVGGNFGYQWGELTNSGARPSGGTGGFQGGYNWQYGQFVAGVETDLQFSSNSDTFNNYKFSNPWFGTVRGRGGIAMNNILFYGTLGLAYGRGHVASNGFGEDNFHPGWATGVGLEVGLASNWSVRAEYLYIDLADESYFLTGTSNGLRTNLGRFGVNYRF
jgi:outer membrane immunogenic protein